LKWKAQQFLLVMLCTWASRELGNLGIGVKPHLFLIPFRPELVEGQTLNRLHRELDAQGVSDFHHGFKTRLRTWRQRLVQALSVKTGIFGDLRHTFCTGRIAKGKQKKVGVVGFHHGRHVLGDGVIVFQVLGRIKRDQFQWGLGFCHQSSPI
jgi:hypothetical protein